MLKKLTEFRILRLGEIHLLYKQLIKVIRGGGAVADFMCCRDLTFGCINKEIHSVPYNLYLCLFLIFQVV